MCLSANQNVKVDLYTSPLPAVLKMVSFLIIFRLTTLFENNLKCLWVIMSKGFSGVKGFSGKESACQFKKMQEMWVWSLGWEDPLEEEMAIHSSILVWRIPWTEEPGGYSLWRRRVRYDWATRIRFSLWSSLSLFYLNFFLPTLFKTEERVRQLMCQLHEPILDDHSPEVSKLVNLLGLQPLLLSDPLTEAHHPSSHWSPGLRSHLGESGAHFWQGHCWSVHPWRP